MECSLLINQPTKNCYELFKVCKLREDAHRDCREYHKKIDQCLKIATLLSSAATTYIINSHSDVEAEEDSGYVSERFMSFTTTVISGGYSIFNANSKALKHHTTSRNFQLLANEIEVKIRNKECKKEDYTTYSDKYREILTNSLSIFFWVRKRYPGMASTLSMCKPEPDFTVSESKDQEALP